MTAQLEIHISCRFDDPNRNFQQLEPDGVDTILSHGFRQSQTSKPVKKIVGQCVNLNPVCVDDHGRTADIAHVEAGFTLLDEVFHLSSLTVKANQILR